MPRRGLQTSGVAVPTDRTSIASKHPTLRLIPASPAQQARRGTRRIIVRPCTAQSLCSRSAPSAVRPRPTSNTARLPSQVLVLPCRTQAAGTDSTARVVRPRFARRRSSRPTPCAVRPRPTSNTARLTSQVLVLPRRTQAASTTRRCSSQRVVPPHLTCPGWRAQPNSLTVHAGGARSASRR